MFASHRLAYCNEMGFGRLHPEDTDTLAIASIMACFCTAVLITNARNRGASKPSEASGDFQRGARELKSLKKDWSRPASGKKECTRER